MAIFRPPPQPFVGGWQPLAPHVLPASITAVPADDPPFAHLGRASPAFWKVLDLWQPDPGTPWRGFVTTRNVPQYESIITEDPPFGSRWAWQHILVAWQPGPPRPEPIRARPNYYLSRDIRGVTRDSGGNVLGNCAVKCYDTLTDVVIFSTTSDGNGNFAGTVPNDSQHYLVAYKTGTPDVAGSSVNTLTGS